MYNKYKQRFAIKKFTIGVASVFIGGTALMASDVLPFNMVNVASASEENANFENNITFNIESKNTKDYMLNNMYEYFRVNISNNNLENLENVRLEVEQNANLKIQIKGLKESEKSTTIGNKTTLNIGELNTETNYNIPVFAKYIANTKNNTPATIKFKLVSNITNQVLKEETIDVVNKAKEIVSLLPEDKTFQAGTYNTLTNKLHYSDPYYYNERLLTIDTETINEELPDGGDYIKYTVENNNDIYSIIKTSDGYVLNINNNDTKVVEPVRIKAEVFDSNNISKNIVEYFNMTPTWEDISVKTTYVKEHIDEDVDPLLPNSSRVTIKKYISAGNSYISSLLKAVKLKSVTSDVDDNNTIKYDLTTYIPKEYSIKIEKDSNILTDKKIKINIDFNKDIKNLEKSKIWYKTTENGEKQYFHNNKTLLNVLKEKPQELVIYGTDDNVFSYYYQGVIFGKLTWDETLKYYNITEEEMIKDLYDSSLKLSLNFDYNNLAEIGLDFSEDTIVMSGDPKIDKDYMDYELEKESTRGYILGSMITFEADNKYSLNSTSDNDNVIYKSKLIYNDNTILEKDTSINVEYDRDYTYLPIISNFNKYKTEKLNTLEGEKINIKPPTSTFGVLTKNIKNKRLLISNVEGVDNDINQYKKAKSIVNIEGKQYTLFVLEDAYVGREGLDILFKENANFIRNRKNEDYYSSENIEILLQIQTEDAPFIVNDPKWQIVQELSNEDFTTYKYVEPLSFNLIFPEELKISNKIENVTNIYKDAKPNDTLKISTGLANFSKQTVDNVEVIQEIPKLSNSSTGLDTIFSHIDNTPQGWSVYYSTTIMKEKDVSTIIDWVQEIPSDKSTITYVKWVKNSVNSSENVNFDIFVNVSNRYDELKSKIYSNIFSKSSNNDYINTKSSVEIEKPIKKLILNIYLDNNKNGIFDAEDIKINTNDFKEYSRFILVSNQEEVDSNNNIITKDTHFDRNKIHLYHNLSRIKDSSILEKIANHKVNNIVYSIGDNERILESDTYIPDFVRELNVGIQLDEEFLEYKIAYYDINTNEIIKEEIIPSLIAFKHSNLYLKNNFKHNNFSWSIDLETVHRPLMYNIRGESFKGLDLFDNELYEHKKELYMYTTFLNPDNTKIYIPVKKDKSGSVDVVLVNKATGEPLKVTNIVTEDSKPAGETVTIEESDAPEYITIGDKTYKKVEKPDLPTEAVVPGATDNADVEFEYEVVRGAVYGVFKTEEGNNIIKDKVTIIEGGQPEDTTREYTAPGRITDDNGKVWELVSPAGSVTYTNGENATEHILTYREVKKNVTLKYVTSTGETIKEEVAFENKSVGSKYRINTPETITKDNVIYNVSGEREIAGAVEDNDNIITIEVSPKPKQVAIIKFVNNNGEEISGIERQRVEGYDGININVTLENIPNYRIINNPFETAQIFDTDNNVDQEFSVVLEKLPTTAIPFETEYVADETREYGSENITEREGVEGVREDNGEVSRQPVNKVVKVATGSKVERKETPFNIIYEADENKVFGDNSTTKGKNKVEEITTTYTLDTTTGVVTPNTPTTVVIEAGNPETHTFGTKSTVTTEDIPFTTEYVGDNSVDYGTENVNTEGTTGVRTTTTTYRLDEDNHTVIANNPIVSTTKQPVNKVIAKGTKPTVTTEDIPFTTEYVGDNTVDYGTENVSTEGTTGVRTTTITYRFYEDSHTVVANNPIVDITKQPVNKVVAKGTKTTTVTEDIPFIIEYIEDNTLDYGTENVYTEGVNGVKTTTTTYRLDGDTVIANEPVVSITKQPTSKVITKGTKPTETVIRETAFTTITKEDPTLTKGEEVVEVEGVNGKTVNITEYTVNRETGEVTSTTREEVREAVNKVVRVGTKETPANETTDTTEETPNTNNEDNNTTENNSNENGTTETTEDTTTGNENTNVEENNTETETVTEETTETKEENSSTTNTPEVETDTLTAEEEKAKEDKHSDAWEETANEYNKQKETVTDENTKDNDKVENSEESATTEDNTETDTSTVAEVKAKELPETNTNNSLLYTATALIGLATLLRRKEQ